MLFLSVVLLSFEKCCIGLSKSSIIDPLKNITRQVHHIEFGHKKSEIHRLAMSTITIYSAMRQELKPIKKNNLYTKQDRGELAGGGSKGLHIKGVYFTTVKEQAESWAEAKADEGYNFICQAEIPLEWYSELTSLVFAPDLDESKNGPFQRELITLNKTEDQMTHPDRACFNYTCTDHYSFEEFLKANMNGDGYDGFVPVINNYLDKDDDDNHEEKEDDIKQQGIKPADMDVIEASIMCGVQGQQMFFSDFSQLHTIIKDNAVFYKI